MRQTCIGEQGKGIRAAVMLAGALALAGCSSASSVGSPDSSPSLSSRLSGYFTGSKQAPAAPAAPAQPIAATVDCPGVDIRQGAATLSMAAKTAQAPTAADLRYQLSFGQFARECRAADGSLSIKVGVQGRVVVGPQGGPGNVDVPLRYAVVREGPEPKTIVTRFKRVAVTVGPGDTNVGFTDVEDGLSFPIPPAAELEAYVVYVGFDEIGDKPAKPAPKTAKQRPPKTQ
jgi:hypothetical protein